MPVKRFKSLTCRTEIVDRLQKIANALGLSIQELMASLTKNEVIIPLALKRFGEAKVTGPFARKSGSKLERYFLVDDEAFVTEEWAIENADSVKIV